MPNAGQQARKDDERIKVSHETPSPDGKYIRGYLVRPFSADSRRRRRSA
jgi:hypothetical protein